jgi:25S rRNA (adenine2142-N1)-methyltransferase
MGRARTRKVPITKTISAGSSTSSSNTRSVIRRFHVLLKTKSQTKHDLKKLAEIDAEIEQLGGLDAYQQMSKIGQSTDRGGGTEKVFIHWLKHLGVRGQSKLKYDPYLYPHWHPERL